MIIVNQRKTGIVNFDNTETLLLIKINDKHGTKEVQVCARGNYDYVLGEYQTEERAKEVLQEIAKIYGADIMTVPVYEMPKD